MLKNNPDSAETERALAEWILKEQSKADRSGNIIAGQIHFSLRLARLYFCAGMTEQAISNFEDARIYASNMGFDDLLKEIEKEMDGVGL